MENWAQTYKLAEQTLAVLVDDGFDTLEEICQLTLDDVDTFYTATGRLQKAQCLRLRTAVEALKNATTQGQAVNAGNTCLQGNTRRTFNQSEGARTQTSEPKKEVALLSRDNGATDVKNQDGTSTFKEAKGFFSSLVAKAQDSSLMQKARGISTAISTHRTKGKELDFKVEEEILHSTPEDYKSQIRFLLVGKTGVGKSTTGNTILGSEMFGASVGFHSETLECEVYRRSIFGVTVEVTDTPGLFDTSLGENTIAKVIAQAVACMHPGPHIFLFLVKIGNRFTQEEAGTYKRLVAIFDQSVTKYMIIVFTAGDNLRPGQTIDDILQKAPQSLKEILEACGNRYVVFNNNAAAKQPQVEDLLQAAYKLIEKNGNTCYKCPKYFFVEKKIDEEIQKRMVLVEQTEGRLKERIKELEKKNKELEEIKMKFEEELVKQRENQLGKNQETKEMEEMDEELNKKHNKEVKELQEKVEKMNNDVETMKREVKEAEERLLWEELNKLKNKMAKNDEKGLLETLADSISDTASWAWNGIKSLLS